MGLQGQKAILCNMPKLYEKSQYSQIQG